VKIERTDIEGLALLHLEGHQDQRGSFLRTYCRDALTAAGLPFELVQANLSRNPARHTLRGLHFQLPPHQETKIIVCVRGRIWDVAVDVRPGSRTFGQWRGFELSAEANRGLYLAAGLAHGFLTLEPDSDVHYLVDSGYAPHASAGISWRDPALAIAWPAEPAVMSERDRTLPALDRTR
jgi:dTDP-4-dehydrorhamnose 3,5-epimerase